MVSAGLCQKVILTCVCAANAVLDITFLRFCKNQTTSLVVTIIKQSESTFCMWITIKRGKVLLR